MKRFIGFFVLMLSLFHLNSALATLTAGASYTVTLSKVNSDGTVTDIGTTVPIVADSNGKLAFNFTSNVPTVTDTNWLAFTIKDKDGVVVRKGLGPAVASTETLECGLNGLSDVQARAILNGFANSKTDDPFYGMFGLMMLRSPTLTESDRNLIASGGNTVILGTGGVVDYLKNTLGVTAAQYSTFVKKIANNTASGSKDLSDYCSNFKGAVDNDNGDLTAKAGGFLADVVIDAANAAGFDIGLITTAMEAAGELADTNTDFNRVSSAANNMMDQAISNFFKRLRSIKVKTEYGNAFTALGSTGATVTRFNTAVDVLLACFSTMDAKYRDKFESQNIDTATQQAMNTDYGSCFTTFQSSIRSTDAEVATVKTACATKMSVSEAQMPSDFGKNYSFAGTLVNQVIPSTVLDNFVCTVIGNGGSIDYTRHTLSIPTLMLQWLTTKSDFDTTLSALNGSFIDLAKIKEDIEIIQATLWDTFSSGTPTFAKMKAAKALLQSRLDATADRITGTTNGTTALSAAQKKGIVKMILEPDIN